MATPTRWVTETKPGHSEWYIERFRTMEADGADLAGEGRLVDAMVRRNARILDAGCGPGRTGAYLHQVGHDVVGVDADPKLIAAAEIDHPGPRWLTADLSELDLPSMGEADPFDAIVLAGNVMVFIAPGTEVDVLRRCAAHLTDRRLHRHRLPHEPRPRPRRLRSGDHRCRPARRAPLCHVGPPRVATRGRLRRVGPPPPVAPRATGPDPGARQVRGNAGGMTDEYSMTEKEVLHRYLTTARDALVWKLDGLGEYDIRRPMTPTGTNLLGLVKHVASVADGYFGEVFGRPSGEPLPWFDDDAEPNADMWATTDESRDDIVALYHRAWARVDATIEALDLDAVGHVPWWTEAHSHPRSTRSSST